VRVGKSLLIVDDDPGVRTLYGNVLTRAGFNVSLAEDGNVAVRMMETSQADLVLVDMLMPHKDGVGTIMDVRDRWPACIVVAMSGGGWIGKEDCLELARIVGAHGIIRKPTPILELVQTLSIMLGETLNVQLA
jgi:DNA-binding response OmpR family regulator